MTAKQTAESFWARVSNSKEQYEGCWEWSGSCNTTGYGTVSWRGRVYTAHRVAAWLSGMVENPKAPTDTSLKAYVLHKCDNRKCCNPNHLFLGNFSDNQLDAYKKYRRSQPKGSKHANAKLTHEQANIIRNLYKSGMTQIKLAEKFKVSQRAISLIVRRETYR
jgi:hypothetical protein